MPIDPRLRRECGALRLIYAERQLRVRVRGEAKKPQQGTEDMRRQKYGRANFKYVKVERDGSGRVAIKKRDKKPEREMVST